MGCVVPPVSTVRGGEVHKGSKGLLIGYPSEYLGGTSARIWPDLAKSKEEELFSSCHMVLDN